MEEPAAVQVENEDGDDEDDDEGCGEEKDDDQEARLVGGKLFELNVFQFGRKGLSDRKMFSLGLSCRFRCGGFMRGHAQ